MKETKSYYDHCGKELNQSKDIIDTDTFWFGVKDNVDVCDECFHFLADYVKTYFKAGKE